MKKLEKDRHLLKKCSSIKEAKNFIEGRKKMSIEGVNYKVVRQSLLIGGQEFWIYEVFNG